MLISIYIDTTNFLEEHSEELERKLQSNLQQFFSQEFPNQIHGLEVTVDFDDHSDDGAQEECTNCGELTTAYNLDCEHCGKRRNY